MLQVPTIPSILDHRKVLQKTHTKLPNKGMDKNKSALCPPTGFSTQTMICKIKRKACISQNNFTLKLPLLSSFPQRIFFQVAFYL